MSATAFKAGAIPGKRNSAFLQDLMAWNRATGEDNDEQLERLRRECSEIETELAAIEEEMNGSAATDYVRLAELDTKKNALEERLLEIYEEI